MRVVDDKQHRVGCTVPPFEITLLDRRHKTSDRILFDIAFTRFSLDLNNASGGLVSLPSSFGYNDLNLTVQPKVILRDLAEDALHLMHDSADSVKPFPLLKF